MALLAITVRQGPLKKVLLCIHKTGGFVIGPRVLLTYSVSTRAIVWHMCTSMPLCAKCANRRIFCCCRCPPRSCLRIPTIQQKKSSVWYRILAHCIDFICFPFGMQNFRFFNLIGTFSARIC